MDSDDEALYDFVTSRYPNLRRSAFLMGGDWALAEEHTQAALARLVSEAQRGTVEDPDAQVYAHLMAAYQHRPGRREHVFVAPSDSTREEADDPVRTVLVLDALHKLSPRCRAVVVLRHWDGFAVDETADMLGLADERVEAYEAAGLAALDDLLATGEAPAGR
jgi:DNA-directed RNA polymerase specialized sigma24 family protein